MEWLPWRKAPEVWRIPHMLPKRGALVLAGSAMSGKMEESERRGGEGRIGGWRKHYRTEELSTKNVSKPSRKHFRAPTTCGIRQRMIYASSKLALRQRLDGIHTEVQATDAAELAFESVFEQIAPKLATAVIKPPKSAGSSSSADVEAVAEKVEKLDVKEEGEEKKEE